MTPLEAVRASGEGGENLPLGCTQTGPGHFPFFFSSRLKWLWATPA